MHRILTRLKKANLSAAINAARLLWTRSSCSQKAVRAGHRAQPKSNIIAYQIRQSFRPGEITAEEANRIGYELASRFLKGKHAFIVATHTDREHIHNHIIYNSTTLDGTRKFRDFFFSGLAVQRLSDLICLEHQLSVIEKKPYRERQKRITYPQRKATATGCAV